MAFYPRLVKTLSLVLSFAVATPANAQNLEGIWAEVLGDINITPQSAFEGRDVSFLRDQILQARGDFIANTLRRGHNNLLREQIGQENNAAPNRRRFFTMQESFAGGSHGDLARGVDPTRGAVRRVERNDRARLVTTEDGENLIACRLGSLETRIIDPTEISGGGARRSAVFVQLCAGEQFTDVESCRLDLSSVNTRVLRYRTEISRRIQGVTNWVAFSYTMSDPAGFEGCSTIEGLRELLRRSSISGEGRENFGAANTAVRMNAIYRACTDFRRLTINSEGSTIGEVDQEFEDLVRRKLPRSRIIVAARNSQGDEAQTPAADDLFGPRFRNGMEGSVAQLRVLLRRVGGRANNGLGQCSSLHGGGGARTPAFGGGGMRGERFGDGMRGNGPGIAIGR